MILTFYVSTLARWQGLCDIDDLYFRTIQIDIKREVLARRNYTDYKSNGKTQIIGLISP